MKGQSKIPFKTTVRQNVILFNSTSPNNASAKGNKSDAAKKSVETNDGSGPKD